MFLGVWFYGLEGEEASERWQKQMAQRVLGGCFGGISTAAGSFLCVFSTSLSLSTVVSLEFAPHSRTALLRWRKMAAGCKGVDCSDGTTPSVLVAALPVRFFSVSLFYLYSP